MTNLKQQEALPAISKTLLALLLGVFAVIFAGCAEERDEADGQLTNTIVLPTDTLLNLACENVGINDETCVLDDPENPYASVSIIDPQISPPGNKFDLFDAIPTGPTGAKARFYLWATALANFPSGENQWYTARALHELYTYNGDELIRLQALKAYRSNLDNFFGSVSYFDQFGFGVPSLLNELAACHIYRPPDGWAEICLDASGLACSDLGKLELFGSWGFAVTVAPNGFADPCNGGLVYSINFP